MKKLLILSLIFACLSAHAQKYVSEKSFVSFFSDALLEDITADNKKASSIINTATNDIAFSIPIKEFQFAKSLMQEHFNEKYMESDKYPKSTFQGKLNGFDMKSTSVQNVKATGKLTIHGVTKDVEIPGTIEVKDSKIYVKSKFIVKVADYKVEIPTVVFQNIAEQVEVTVDFVYKPQ
ncbi:YceI family protein [Pseudochryseolinea flava]|uniref:YceI family protein n=1 Tax=Pseudochryseolinea flava TaxID=2059302 RepID=A0A364Y3D6_9BACT|nr:YceI family protein [Pseudochryseolinea flava]RAW01232.1 YceI family protein [Pseudochryseolinea flava]